MRQELTTFAGVAAPRQHTPGPRAWLLVSPLLLWIAAFVVAPALIMLVYGFCERGSLGGVVFRFTLDNYAAVFSPLYLRILARSVLYAGLTTLACLILAYPTAFFIGQAAPQRQRLLLMLVMIPFWTSFLIRTHAWVTILKSEGVLNAALVQLGVIEAPLELLYTPGAVLVGLVYTFLPFMILPIYTSVERLDRALVDAAFDLGARPLRTFARVILPLTGPGIGAGVLLVFVPALGLYAVNDILGGGSADMIGNVIENQFKGGARNWPFGAALGTVLMAAFVAAMVLGERRGRAREAAP
ncbi:MAG TPA: ABC transporter permease [Candidatus Limnocylindrales bacterium]|nr:ABC transporter permease [Candidatus Limnocylindrales bacterium]